MPHISDKAIQRCPYCYNKVTMRKTVETVGKIVVWDDLNEEVACKETSEQKVLSRVVECTNSECNSRWYNEEIEDIFFPKAVKAWDTKYEHIHKIELCGNGDYMYSVDGMNHGSSISFEEVAEHYGGGFIKESVRTWVKYVNKGMNPARD